MPKECRPIVMVVAGGIARDAHLPAYQKTVMIFDYGEVAAPLPGSQPRPRFWRGKEAASCNGNLPLPSCGKSHLWGYPLEVLTLLVLGEKC
jgi:hypothetical protein